MSISPDAVTLVVMSNVSVVPPVPTLDQLPMTGRLSWS